MKVNRIFSVYLLKLHLNLRLIEKLQIIQYEQVKQCRGRVVKMHQTSDFWYRYLAFNSSGLCFSHFDQITDLSAYYFTLLNTSKGGLPNKKLKYCHRL